MYDSGRQNKRRLRRLVAKGKVYSNPHFQETRFSVTVGREASLGEHGEVEREEELWGHTDLFGI